MRWPLALLLAFLCAPHAHAQSPSFGEDTPIATLKQRVEEVVLYCTVTDHKGALMEGLQQTDVSVLEDKRPVRIAYFSHEDVPVSLALVLDDSGSMKNKRDAIAAAALDLVRASNPQDETSITNFADKAYRDQELTSHITSLERALARNKTISGGTALYDTIVATADELAAHARHRRQVLVVITDGKDNASASDLAAAVRRVQQTNGPEIYTIGLLYDSPNSEAGQARRDLRALSEQTGGLAFFPASLDDVHRIALEVAKDLRSQYTIAFHPLNLPSANDFHTVNVRAKSSKEGTLNVRTRTGFLRPRLNSGN